MTNTTDLILIRWRAANHVDPQQRVTAYTVHRDLKSAHKYATTAATDVQQRASLSGADAIGGRRISVPKHHPLMRAMNNAGAAPLLIPVPPLKKQPSPELRALHKLFRAAGSENNLPVVRIPVMVPPQQPYEFPEKMKLATQERG